MRQILGEKRETAAATSPRRRFTSESMFAHFCVLSALFPSPNERGRLHISVTVSLESPLAWGFVNCRRSEIHSVTIRWWLHAQPLVSCIATRTILREQPSTRGTQSSPCCSRLGEIKSLSCRQLRNLPCFPPSRLLTGFHPVRLAILHPLLLVRAIRESGNPEPDISRHVGIRKRIELILNFPNCAVRFSFSLFFSLFNRSMSALFHCASFLSHGTVTSRSTRISETHIAQY